jgi:hypothetical protein
MKMKTGYIALLCSLLFGATYDAGAQHAAKSVFVEIGGPGLTSLNFDSRFSKKEDGVGGRIGVGYFNIFGERLLLLPLGVNYLLGKDQRNYFEVGGGVTVVSYKSEFIDDDSRFTGTFGHLNFGYRYQPKGGGFTFRAAINPVFTKDGFVPYYGGVSFGYAF